MALKLNNQSRLKSTFIMDDILPRIRGRLTVRYAQKEYQVIGYYDFRDKLILRDLQQPDCDLIVELDKVKPLLRRMDSMTSDEKDRYQSMLDKVKNNEIGVWKVTEWLDRKLFDYNDLIGRGLAEELPTP